MMIFWNGIINSMEMSKKVNKQQSAVINGRWLHSNKAIREFLRNLFLEALFLCEKYL